MDYNALNLREANGDAVLFSDYDILNSSTAKAVTGDDNTPVDKQHEWRKGLVLTGREYADSFCLN